ncbi:hypothetical protein [Helicobacter pylori]|uniref:hypothetical protein n=1 Tax=Helicobacter pylori TaxID=210 RepID=UPI0036F375FD
MQTLKNKAFRVSIQWNALVRKLLSLERGALTEFECLKARLISHALKKVLLWDCRGKISPPIKYSIIKF